MWTKLWDEIARSSFFVAPPPLDIVTEADLASLPVAACALMAFHGVRASTPKHWSFRSAWKGAFKMKPNGSWLPIHAVQYDARSPVTRVFHMSLRLAHVIPVLARDTYVDGCGRLIARAGDLVTVARGRGRELDEGELVTWLNDCILFAPSMLLSDQAHFAHVDERTFDLSFTDRGTTVRARVFVDERGAAVDFETTNRFIHNPEEARHPLVRCRWSTPIGCYVKRGDRIVSARGKATWHLPEGDFTYADFELVDGSLVFDEPPKLPTRTLEAGLSRPHDVL